MFFDIEQSVDWLSVDKILKGWSADEKYQITTKTGEKQLLRISPISQYELKKKEYDIIAKFFKTGIFMSEPVCFGVCNKKQNVFMILSWIDGQDLEDVLPNLSIQEQYNLGYTAGDILKKLHSIPLNYEDVPQKSKKEKKLLQLACYEKSNIRIENDETAIQYVYDNIDFICKEKPVYLHGDFHPGNLIYTKEGEIGVIDFNRWEVGDPYEEFYKMENFAKELSVAYCIGQLKAYFGDDKIPNSFWRALAVYVAHAALYSIKWAEKFGDDEIDGMKKRCKAIFKDYDNFKLTIPLWYK